MSVSPQEGQSPLDNWIDRAIQRLIARPDEKALLRTTFSLNDAMTLGKLAVTEAGKVGIPIVFSVVDGAGNQRYFFSMDNALLISHQLAYHKAWTAAALKMSTHELALQVQPGQSLYGLQNNPKICCFGGGLPCWSQGRLLGALGVSGGTVEQDMAIVSNTLFSFSQSHYLITSSQL